MCLVISAVAFALTITLFYTLVLLQLMRGSWEDEPIGISTKGYSFAPDKTGS